MDARQFVAEFGHIANAPGGVARLRELVLQLAISGRLVERVGSDEAIDDEMAEATKLREAYELKFGICNSRSLRATTQSLFTIPTHWRWACLEDIALYIQRGKGPKYADSGSTYVVSQKCIQWGGFALLQARKITDNSITDYGEERFLCEGDLLWNSTGTGTAGRMAVYSASNEVSVVADSHVTVIRLANAQSRYIWCVIASPWVQARIEPTHPQSLVSGTTQQVELATNAVKSLLIPCPPIEEQSRIVAKVDELMALCDKLEAEQQERRTLQNGLRQATLQAVVSAATPHELHTTWTRLAENFGRLFQGPEDVADLEQSVKQLALRGLLSQHEPNEQVSADLTELTSTSVATVTEVEMDWHIPSHWIWARSEWLGEARLGKMLDAAKNKGEFRPYLRNVNVRWRRFDLTDVLKMRVEDHELKRISVQKGDLVICEGGEPGRAAIWDLDAEYIIQKALHRFRCNGHVLPEYMLLCLEHDFFSGRLSRYYTGATIKHLTGKSLAEYPIPLPPIEEQKRILAVVSELTKFIASLKTGLKASNQCAAALATAAIASFTGITTQQEDEPMKTPQTELIASLRLGQTPDIKAQAPLAAILASHNGEMGANDLWRRFGGEIDAFYAQLKTEVSHGWILEPSVAEMRVRDVS